MIQEKKCNNFLMAMFIRCGNQQVHREREVAAAESAKSITSSSRASSSSSRSQGWHLICIPAACTSQLMMMQPTIVPGFANSSPLQKPLSHLWENSNASKRDIAMLGSGSGRVVIIFSWEFGKDAKNVRLWCHTRGRQTLSHSSAKMARFTCLSQDKNHCLPVTLPSQNKESLPNVMPHDSSHCRSNRYCGESPKIQASF